MAFARAISHDTNYRSNEASTC